MTTAQSDYLAFLASKRVTAPAAGFDVADDAINPALFPFQRQIVRWALRRGRAAIFADCGLGKTGMQLEWAHHVAEHTGGDVLVLTPLAVAQQTHREGQKFGISVAVCRTQADVRPGVNVANYEMLGHFDPAAFAGIVLDESSILKAFDGKTRRALTTFAAGIRYRLACTATPAPNDLVELTNHAEFLDIMSGKEILALWFTQDGNTTHAWRLKGHAHDAFYRWLASWAMALRKPSDLGYPDGDFILPPLTWHQETVEASSTTRDTLFAVEALTLSERRRARQRCVAARVARCAAMVNASAEPWVVWCDLNAESRALARAIPDAVEVTGADAPQHKEAALLDFAEGRVRVLVTKPSIAGHGLNLQHCAHMAFVGLSDSWEQVYQATRRCWRFGQRRPVEVHVITSEEEGAVVRNIRRKDRQAGAMMNELVRHVAEQGAGLDATAAARDEMAYEERQAGGHDWTLYQGDSVLLLDSIEAESVGLSLFSPPFPGMYAYTNSPHDMGNTASIGQMLEQFRYLVGPDKLLRVTMPGRLCCVHLTQSPAFLGTDGYIGLRDFRGEMIRLMEAAGWIYYGEVTIDKDPQVKAARTKEQSLLFKTLATDSARMRMALADYLLYFRKPGENPRPVRAGSSAKYGNGAGWITNDEWIEWAAPVWYRAGKGYPGGIRETDVLNVAAAREAEDERHLCPLQLGVCERAIKLWSAPGDLVLDPFAGVGSVGTEALRLGRRFLGIELKPSYFAQATKNLRGAERVASAATLWGGEEGASA